MNTKWVDDLFYFLNKDYGTRVQYTQIEKGEIDYSTGDRQDAKTSREVDAIAAPITMYQEFLDSVSRSSERADEVKRAKTRFLIRKYDLPETVDPDDYLVHNGLRYTQLHFDDLMTAWVISGVAVTNARAYQVLNLTTVDQLELGDGA